MLNTAAIDHTDTVDRKNLHGKNCKEKLRLDICEEKRDEENRFSIGQWKASCYVCM